MEAQPLNLVRFRQKLRVTACQSQGSQLSFEQGPQAIQDVARAGEDARAE